MSGLLTKKRAVHGMVPWATLSKLGLRSEFPEFSRQRRNFSGSFRWGLRCHLHTSSSKSFQLINDCRGGEPLNSVDKLVDICDRGLTRSPLQFLPPFQFMRPVQSVVSSHIQFFARRCLVIFVHMVLTKMAKGIAVDMRTLILVMKKQP
jgi:hypothetical protein